MGDNAAKVANEQIKGLAMLARNGALVLATAAAARLNDKGFELEPLGWLLGAAFLTYGGTQPLTLLSPEDLACLSS